MTAAFVAVRRFVAAALLRGALAVALVGGSFLVGAGNLASAQQAPSCCRSTGPGAVTAADNGSTSSDGRIKATYTRFQYQAGPFGGANWVEGDVRRTDGGNVLSNGNANSKALSRNSHGNATQGGEIIASGLLVPQEYVAAVWANYPGNTALGGNGFVVRDVAIIYFGTIPTPATPVSLAVGVAPQRVTVNWNRVTYAERLSVVVATHDHAVTVTNIANGALSGNNIAPTRRSHVVTGLSDSRTYTVRARSVGPGGASGEALATITTPMGLQAPEAPVLAVAVTPDRIANPKATLSWTVEDNGTAITAFVLSYGTTQITITDGSATSYTIDLAYNTSYAFTLQALNAGGSSQAAATAVSVASGVPYQPAKPSASATPNGVSPAQITVSWVAPADGGSPITAYRIQHYTKHHTAPGNADYNIVIFTVAASQTMSVFSVNFGVSNIFYVAAINSHGAGNDHFSNNILIAATPVAPTLTVAATPNGVVPAQVTLSWGAPDSNGSAITAYILSGSESATLPASASQTVISISLGVQYHFTLLAANAVGNSPADSAAVSVAALAPGAPAVVASPTPHGVTPPKLTISWTAPAANGGSAITGYRLRFSGGNRLLAATVTSFVISDEEIFYLDSAFNFSVAAINAIGTSAYTAGSALATSTPPFAATTFAAATTPDGETPAQITLSWSAPANGGKNINGYILSYGTVSANLPTSQTASVVNASLGVEYRFTLRAQNEKGAGAPATLAASVVALAPAAPSVRLFPTPDGVQPERLTIRISANADGGSPVTQFRIRYGIYNQSIAVVDGQATHIIADTDIFYMDNDFVFRMGAVNAVGTTFATLTARVSSTAPHMPQNFRFRTYGSTISLNWTPISNDYTNGSGGELITAYILTYRNVSTNFANNIGMAVIAGTVGQPYGFTLRAANVNGIGPAAEIPVFTVGQEPPARPVSLGLWLNPTAEGKLTLSGQDAALQWHVAPNTPSVSVYIVSFNGNSPATVAFVSATIQQHYLGTNSIARGETVAFSVLARNQYGSSPSPAVLLVTVESTNPATVRNLAVTANVARVVATWSAPAHWGGGLPASANRYAYGFVGGVSGNVPNNDTALTLTEIVAGEAIAANTGYTISIYATNAEGKAGMAVAVTFSTPQSPDAPGGVVAMGGNGRIAFEWSAPANLYGQPFSHYEYALLNASNATLAMGSVNAASATVGGGTLANGSDYVFIVRAHSQTDYGDYATLTAAPIAPPTAPALVGTVSDAANNTYIMGGGFSWTAPAGVTGYVVQGDGGDKNLAATATAYALAQYANGQPHTLALLSYNAGLDPSTAVITLTPFSRPGMPSNFAIAPEPGNPNNVTLSWSAPSDNGGFAIAHYSVTAGEFSADNLTDTQVVITNVAQGAEVVASVYAFSGPVSAGVFAQGMAGVYTFTGGMFPPDAPTLAAAKGDKLATLTWAAPYDQGSAITAYIVYVDNTPVYTIIAQVSAYAYTATGLSNGTEYTFAVVAINGVGESAQGTATATPQGVPLAPADFAAAAGNGQATLTWQAANNQGSPITEYIVFVNNTAVHTITDLSTLSHTATGLSIGTNYSFGVAAKNAIGTGATATAAATTPNAPGMPSYLRATGGNGQVELTWGEAYGRGNPVTAYIVFVNGAANVTLPAAARDHTVTGLSNETNYTLGVAAANAVGTGAIFSISQDTANKPGMPRDLFANPGNATVSLFWNAASNRGSAVSGYIVYIDGVTVATLAASARSYAATGLTNGTVYMFGVAAVNAVGTGATAQVSATPEAATEEEKVKEVDKAIAPAVVAAVTRQQTKALNNRIGALISGINVGGGGAGGGNVGGGSSFSMLGATFNKGNLSGGIAQALKQHGGALANGENLDPSVARSGSFALNAGAGNGAGGGGNFGIWGGADYAKIKDDKGDNTLDGHNASFFGGLDTAIASNVVVGVMFFHNRLKTDFASRNARGAQINGEYRLQANGVNPYILWRGANASAWGGFGVGKGERTQEQPQEDINRTDDVDMYSGVFGFRFALLRQDNGFALDAQTDLSRAHTDIAGTKFKSLNLRAMLEARRDIAVIGGGEFSPFVQAAMLRQKDDNESVEGWEAAGGARWNKGASWSGELRGRIARLSNGNQEVGGSGLLRHNVSGNKGLMLSLQPTYGDAGEFSGGDNILTQTTQSAESKPAAQLRADVAYGITGANAHWQPYIGATAGNNAEYRAGVSWQNALLRNSNMRAAIEAKREKQKTGLRFGFSANF